MSISIGKNNDDKGENNINVDSQKCTIRPFPQEALSPFASYDMEVIAEYRDQSATKMSNNFENKFNTVHIAQVITTQQSPKIVNVLVPKGSYTLTKMIERLKTDAIEECRSEYTSLNDSRETTCNKIVTTFLKHLLSALTYLRYGTLILEQIKPENIYYHTRIGFIIAPTDKAININIYSIFSIDSKIISIYNSNCLKSIANGKKNFVSSPLESEKLSCTDRYSLAIVAMELIYNFYYEILSRDQTIEFDSYLISFNGNVSNAFKEICDSIAIDDTIKKWIFAFLKY